MDKITPQNNQNSVLALKTSEQAVFKDFVMSKNIPTVRGFLNNPTNDEFKSEEDKKRSKVAKYSILGAIGLSLLGVAMSPKFLPKKFTGEFKKATDKIIGNTSQKLKPISDKANILNNTNTVKDSFLKKICSYFPPLAWLDKQSSKLYRNMGAKSTAKKFQKAFSTMDSLDNEIKAAVSKLKNKDEILEAISVRNKLMKSYFGTDAQKKYVSELDEAFKGLDERFRTNFINDVVKEKQYKKAFDFMLKDMVEPDKLRFSQQAGDNLKEILEQNKKIVQILKDQGVDVEPLAKKAEKGLNKAVHIQQNDLFDKMRDVATGSAPSDALGIVGSAGALGLYTAQAKTKEERTSVALTTGIPFGLGILGTTAATLKMISGFNAIAIGAATTFVSGILGKTLDKAYKKKYSIEDKQPTIPTLKIPHNTITR